MTEATPVLPRMMSARLLSGGGRSPKLHVWQHSPESLAIQLDSSSSLCAGDECRLELTLPDQSREHTVSVTDCIDTLVGSVAILQLKNGTSKPNAGIQRRGTERYAIGHPISPNCKIFRPMRFGKSICAKVTNISISGFGATIDAESSNITPDQLVRCVMDIPGKPPLDLDARVRAIHRDSDGNVAIRCEFENPIDAAIQTLIEYVACFGTEADTESIIESQSLTWDVSRLFSFDYGLSSTALIDHLDACGALQDYQSGGIGTNVLGVGVRIGNLPVAVFGFAAGDAANPDGRIPFFFYRPETPTLPGAYRILDYVKRVAAKLDHHEILNSAQLLRFATQVVPESKVAKPNKGSVSWSNYAASYDVMCSVNPAYHENLEYFSNWLSTCKMPDRPVIADFGAGTGNYVVEVASTLPDSKILHLERDPLMNQLASKKYRSLGIRNASFLTCDVERTSLSDLAIDAAIMVNSLYSFHSPVDVLTKVFDLLKPGGFLFLIDLGRAMDVADWTRYIVGSSLRTNGFVRTLHAFYQGRHAITQNRRIRQAQDDGIYWKHNATELRTDLESVGFEVNNLDTCYRGYCDSAICTKPASESQH